VPPTKSTKPPRARKGKPGHDDGASTDAGADTDAGHVRKLTLASRAAVRAADTLERAIRVSVNAPTGPTALHPFKVALVALCDMGEPNERAAYEMAMTGINALMLKDPVPLAFVRHFDAWRRGSNDPDSPALAIRGIADAVGISPSTSASIVTIRRTVPAGRNLTRRLRGTRRGIFGSAS
jgi:hypothetical protein